MTIQQALIIKETADAIRELAESDLTNISNNLLFEIAEAVNEINRTKEMRHILICCYDDLCYNYDLVPYTVEKIKKIYEEHLFNTPAHGNEDMH